MAIEQTKVTTLFENEAKTIALAPRTVASAIDGSLAIGQGGTGATTWKSALDNLNVTRLFSSMVPYGTNIGSNKDLNTLTYLKVGNYYCTSNVNAQTLTNCPVRVAFMMQIYSPLATTLDNESTGTWVYRIRKLMTYTGIEYIQQCWSEGTAGVWKYGEWTQIAKLSNITLGQLGVTATATELNYLSGVTSNVQTQLSSKLPLAGGNMTGHIYLTGANANSSTGNTSQLVFGTSSNNHIAISSNHNALILNPTISSTSNQIVLYLDQASVFPSGLRVGSAICTYNTTKQALQISFA